MTLLLSNDIYIVNFYDIYKRLQNTNNVFEVAHDFASIEYQIHVKNTYTLCRWYKKQSNTFWWQW